MARTPTKYEVHDGAVNIGIYTAEELHKKIAIPIQQVYAYCNNGERYLHTYLIESTLTAGDILNDEDRIRLCEQWDQTVKLFR